MINTANKRDALVKLMYISQVAAKTNLTDERVVAVEVFSVADDGGKHFGVVQCDVQGKHGRALD